MGGVSVLLLPYATKYWALVVFSCAYGTSDGIFISTANYIPLSCVDEKRKTAAFCIECLLHSFSVATGGPIAGKTFSRRICRGSLLRLPLNYRPFHVPVFRFFSLKLGGKSMKRLLHSSSYAHYRFFAWQQSVKDAHNAKKEIEGRDRMVVQRMTAFPAISH